MARTPGPWFLHTDGTIRTKNFNSDMMGDCQGCIVCDLTRAVGSEQWPSKGREHAMPEALANARLIAEAPQMLTVLKHLADVLDHHDVKITGASGGLRGGLIEVARNVIARAEGR